MPKTITAIIPLKGISEGKRHVTYDAEGFVGTECKTVTEAFQAALGVQTDETIKPEYYETEQRQEFLNNDG